MAHLTPDMLTALSCVRPPEALTGRVMAALERDQRLRPFRLALAGASCAVWAVAVHQAVQFAATQLQGLA